MRHIQQSTEQKLIDIMFQVGITIATYDCFRTMTQDEIAEWIAKQLRDCGFDTTPAGASWGVLKNAD